MLTPIIVYSSWSSGRRDTSDLNILFVNRQISAEASRIFYRRNRFRIPDDRYWFRLLMSRHKDLIRHVTISFHHDIVNRKPNVLPKLHVWRNLYGHRASNEAQLHTAIINEMEADLTLQLHLLRSLPKLRTLVIDFGSFWIPDWMSSETFMEEVMFDGLLHALLGMCSRTPGSPLRI